MFRFFLSPGAPLFRSSSPSLVPLIFLTLPCSFSVSLSFFGGILRSTLLTRSLIFTIFACIISRREYTAPGFLHEGRRGREREEKRARECLLYLRARGINPATRDELFHNLPRSGKNNSLSTPPSIFSLSLSRLHLSEGRYAEKYSFSRRDTSPL